MARTKPAPRPHRLSAGLIVALTAALTLSGVSPAQAATATDTWGPQGMVTTSDSPVTVHWDNGGETPTADVVARDAGQVLPHTGGKTYDDLPDALRTPYGANFSAANGVVGADGGKGLQMAVSQTKGLVHQSVAVSISGARGNQGTTVFLMQCWGAANESSPDPAHCESGATSQDNGFSRGGALDPQDQKLIAPADSAAGKTVMPLVAIDGVGNGDLFGATTTNELNLVQPDNLGNVSTTFEVQTGSESSFLGCGFRGDAPSTNTCWLVAVPYNVGVLQRSGALDSPQSDSPLTPSLWAQRMQVKLGMADVQAGCPNGQARTLGAGSEMLPVAMQSWAPGLCAAKNIALGYTKLGDEQVRQQYAAGAQSLIFTSRPVADPETTVYAPVALSGLVISYLVDDSHTGKQDVALKLTPLLITKLLTETYRAAIDNSGEGQTSTKAPWVKDQPDRIYVDPDFAKLNPDISANNPLSAGDLVVSNLRSDAAQQLWQWLLADPAAKAFLDGCPDDNGTVINPFYSTRSYAECPAQATQLEAAAKAKRDATKTPEAYVDEPAVYPSDGTIFPQPDWYERDFVPGNNGSAGQAPLTLVDLHAHTNTLADSGKAAAGASYPSNTTWCVATIDPSCDNGLDPGMWKSSGARQSIGQRVVMSVTDAATAALFQTPTAQLCDDGGTHCVGATQTSLQKAATEYVTDGATGVATPPDAPDYAGGAYPLTVAVYAAVNTNGLLAADATALATALSYLSTTGQKPGTSQGNLPPGYAPLTSAMVAQATAAVARLKTAPPADDSDQSGGDGGIGDTGDAGFGDIPDTSPVPSDAPQPSPSPTQHMVEAGAVTKGTEIGFPQFGLIVGLAAAVLAVAIAPVLGRKRKVTKS